MSPGRHPPCYRSSCCAAPCRSTRCSVAYVYVPYCPTTSANGTMPCAPCCPAHTKATKNTVPCPSCCSANTNATKSTVPCPSCCSAYSAPPKTCAPCCNTAAAASVSWALPALCSANPLLRVPVVMLTLLRVQ
ncbi:hypothetical protein JTB14_000882 [Gonioctena quinquepunctata]|nr:hypothetical protein JTB14_000882 [Gonioctena quinquepunctata]